MTEALSTRLGRVIQQLRSFDQLHASELEAIALELGDSEVARRLHAISDIQRDETRIVIAELVEIQNSVSAAEEPVGDPSTSPKYQKWLAEQAAEAERLKQPLSRRGLFDRVASAGDDVAPSAD